MAKTHEKERELKGFQEATSRGELKLEGFTGEEVGKVRGIERGFFRSESVRGMGGGRDEWSESEKSKTGILRKIGATLMAPATASFAAVGMVLYGIGIGAIHVAKYFGYDHDSYDSIDSRFFPDLDFRFLVGIVGGLGEIVGTTGAYLIDQLRESYGGEPRKFVQKFDDDSSLWKD